MQVKWDVVRFRKPLEVHCPVVFFYSANPYKNKAHPGRSFTANIAGMKFSMLTLAEVLHTAKMRVIQWLSLANLDTHLEGCETWLKIPQDSTKVLVDLQQSKIARLSKLL